MLDEISFGGLQHWGFHQHFAVKEMGTASGLRDTPFKRLTAVKLIEMDWMWPMPATPAGKPRVSREEPHESREAVLLGHAVCGLTPARHEPTDGLVSPVLLLAQNQTAQIGQRN